jgi:hypothetical protein
MINMPGSDDQLALATGSQLDVFCETCWRIWTTFLGETYRDSADFDARNRLIVPSAAATTAALPGQPTSQ